MDGEKRYTLQEATQVFYGSKLSKRTLRREFKRYEIPLERLGNKDFCTAADIDALRKAGREGKPCHADDCPSASNCAKPDPTGAPSGSFSTERRRLALAQARTMCRRLKKPLKNISPTSTDLPAASPVRLISSSTK
jgi:hypothetical protein